MNDAATTTGNGATTGFPLPVLDAAKIAAAAWARDFDETFGGTRDPGKLQMLKVGELLSGDTMSRAIARMDFVLFVILLVQYNSPKRQREKCREVELVTESPMCPRQYWNALDRAHHYVAGVESALLVAAVR